MTVLSKGYYNSCLEGVIAVILEVAQWLETLTKFEVSCKISGKFDGC